MIVFHDYQCDQCGHIQEDVAGDNSKPTVRVTPCTNAPCEGSARMLFRTFNRFRHDHPTLYGRPDPQIDARVPIRDHGHKQRLMREKGLREADDAVKGDRERRDEWETPEIKKGPDLPVITGESLAEIDAQLGSPTQLLQ